METPYTFKEYIEWLEPIYNIPNEFPDCQLVVKLHPAERSFIKIHRQFKKSISEKSIIITDANSITELINTCDILITWLSTTAVEAILMNKNVISFNITGRDWQLPFVEYGAAMNESSKDGLYLGIKAILTGDNKVLGALMGGRKKYLESYFSNAEDGTSLTLIEKILQC